MLILLLTHSVWEYINIDDRAGWRIPFSLDQAKYIPLKIYFTRKWVIIHGIKVFVDLYDDNYRADMVQFLTSLDDEIRYNDTEVEKAPTLNEPSYFIG